jgi:hypothetical protein
MAQAKIAERVTRAVDSLVSEERDGGANQCVIAYTT